MDFSVLKAVCLDLLNVNLCLLAGGPSQHWQGWCLRGGGEIALRMFCAFFSWQLWKQMRQQRSGQTKQEIKDAPTETCGFSFVFPLTERFRWF